MALTERDKEIVGRIAYEEKLITTDLKPKTLFDKLSTLRSKLCDAANADTTITYAEATNEFTDVHRFRIGSVLGILGLLEHEKGNPLLPAIVINKKKGRAGEGFFQLLEVCDYSIPDSETQRMELWQDQLNRVYNHDW